MNDLTTFTNPEFGQVRTVEIDGTPWLVGKDVAVALGYKNPQRAIRDHVDAEDKGVTKTVTPSGEQEMKIKSGVWYWLAVASGAVGLLYGMGLEGSFQTGGTVSDGAFITAMVLILLAVFFARLGFAAHDREQQERRKVHQQPRNTVKSGRKAG